jgi:hypothetical protein
MRWVAVVLSVVAPVLGLAGPIYGDTIDYDGSVIQYAFRVDTEDRFFRDETLDIGSETKVNAYLLLNSVSLPGYTISGQAAVSAYGVNKVQITLGADPLTAAGDSFASISANAPSANNEDYTFTPTYPEQPSDSNTAALIVETTTALETTPSLLDPDLGLNGIPAIFLGTFTFTPKKIGLVTFRTQGFDSDSTDMTAKTIDSGVYMSLFPTEPPETNGEVGQIYLTLNVVAVPVPLPSVAWSAILGLGVLGISRTVGRIRLHA